MNLRRHSVGIGPFAAAAPPAADRGILNEEAFHRLISLERRRTERSRKPFLLMLLDMGDHIPSEGTVKILGKMADALSLSTRETDVAGWYKSDCVVGVMFTEIGIEDRNSIVSTMIARLSATLRTDLSLEQFNQISVSFHLFPEEWNHDEPQASEQSNALPRFVQASRRKAPLQYSETNRWMLGAALWPWYLPLPCFW